MYAVLRRNLRDLRIIASQVQRLQARNPQTTQTLVRTYMQGKGSRAEINNIWIQVQSFTYVFTKNVGKNFLPTTYVLFLVNVAYLQFVTHEI